MEKLIIRKSTLEDFLKKNTLENEDRNLLVAVATSTTDTVAVDPEEISDALIRHIVLTDTFIDNETKTRLSLALLENGRFGSDETVENPWDFKVRNLNGVYKAYEKIKDLEFNMDYEFLERRYPVKILMTLHRATKYQKRYISIEIVLKIRQELKNINVEITNDQIVDIRKNIKDLTFRRLMMIYKFHEQTENIDNYFQKLSKSKELQKNSGKQMLCDGIGINGNFKSILLNNSSGKNAAIIEGEWEVVQQNNRYADDNFKNITELPFIRVFSLFYKWYYYVHIDDVSDYVYDDKAFEKLILPTEMKAMIEKVFSYSLKNLIGDIVNYKHGGLIVMAEGNPGVGKTSTAEVYSELNKKPLYVVQLSEIGMDVRSIESNLERIFRRVERWGAIILFDEIDVFLSKRNEDLQKSAVVGVFLRLMDYFRGIMFLTTNRSDVIDHAVLSRITVNIVYPDLDKETRRIIWNAKLKEAGMAIDSVEELSKLNLNGRQIRNMVRLGKIVFDTEIKEAEYIKLIQRSVPNYKQ